MNFVKKLEIRSWKLEVCGMGLRAMIADHGSRINGKLGSMNNNHGLPLVAGRIDNGRNADLPVTCSLIAVRPQAAACPARPLNTHCPGRSHLSLTARRAAFSLAEILIAIFVLSIGLIMIASVFPVAAKWTAQDAETSVAQVIAKNAVNILKTQYPTYFSASYAVPVTNAGGQTLYYVPYCVGPFSYSFGSSQPYPSVGNTAPFPRGIANAPNPSPPQPPGQYYWTAAIAPAVNTTAGTSGIPSGFGPSNGVYSVAIFVFSKGDTNSNFFNQAPAPNGLANQYAGTSASPVPIYPYSQTVSPSNPSLTYATSYYPQLFGEFWNPGTAGDAPDDPAFPVGAIGFDANTGQVFRKIVDANNNIIASGGATSAAGGTVYGPQPRDPTNFPPNGDYIIFAPPAIGQTASPLIYVYVTTVNE